MHVRGVGLRKVSRGEAGSRADKLPGRSTMQLHNKLSHEEDIGVFSKAFPNESTRQGC